MLRPIKVANHVQAFGRWWLGEALSLLPNRVADWLVERGSRTLVITPDEESISFQLMSDRRRLVAANNFDHAEYSADLIDAFLESHRVNRRIVPLGVRIPPSSVFCRSFALPLQTKRSLDSIVVQDLIAKTPFELESIHHAHVTHRAQDKYLVWQWVVRRQHIADVAEALGLDTGEIAFVEAPAAMAENGPLPMIALRPAVDGRTRWVRWTSLTLIVTALTLGMIAVGAKVHHQRFVLDSLETQITAARNKAKAVQAKLASVEGEEARLAQLRSARSEVGLLDIWDEATRVLPSHTWLSELRLSETADGRQVAMTGFSAAATRLVSLIEQSPLFEEAGLAGPVTMDPTENKERFAIQANVAKAAKPRTASR